MHFTDITLNFAWHLLYGEKVLLSNIMHPVLSYIQSVFSIKQSHAIYLVKATNWDKILQNYLTVITS